jgi:dihydrofolate reductase
MSLDGVIESPEEWSSPFFSDEMGRDLIIRDADMEELKAKGDGDFHITGSGTLVRNWIRRGLVDEVILTVCLVLVGAGKRFFENGPRVQATQRRRCPPVPASEQLHQRGHEEGGDDAGVGRERRSRCRGRVPS